MQDISEAYYYSRLQDEEEYKDFVCNRLWRNESIFVGPYLSRKFQKEHGESQSGIAIAFDRHMNSTGKIFIETGRKETRTAKEFEPSGIYAKNSWLYIVGDYTEAYAFSTRQMIRIVEDAAYRRAKGIEELVKSIKKGFLYPTSAAIDGYAIRHFVFS